MFSAFDSTYTGRDLSLPQPVGNITLAEAIHSYSISQFVKTPVLLYLANQARSPTPSLQRQNSNYFANIAKLVNGSPFSILTYNQQNQVFYNKLKKKAGQKGKGLFFARYQLTGMMYSIFVFSSTKVQLTFVKIFSVLNKVILFCIISWMCLMAFCMAICLGREMAHKPVTKKRKGLNKIQ